MSYALTVELYIKSLMEHQTLQRFVQNATAYKDYDIRDIGYNSPMTGLTCSICGQTNATQVTTSGTYCVSCYGRYYENRKR